MCVIHTYSFGQNFFVRAQVWLIPYVHNAVILAGSRGNAWKIAQQRVKRGSTANFKEMNGFSEHVSF